MTSDETLALLAWLREDSRVVPDDAVEPMRRLVRQHLDSPQARLHLERYRRAEVFRERFAELRAEGLLSKTDSVISAAKRARIATGKAWTLVPPT